MANISQLLWNAAEFIEKWQQFIAAPAGTVTLEYYDRNGVLKIARFDNRAKLVQDFIQNVSSAMSKTFYVDQENGNDGNDGSINAPFKSLLKAFKSIPTGGYGKIFLKGSYTVSKDTGYAEYTGTNKFIEIIGELDENSQPKYILKNSAQIGTYSQIIINPGTTLWIKDLIVESNDNGNPANHWKMLLKGGIGFAPIGVILGRWDANKNTTKLVLNDVPLIDYEINIGFLQLIRTDIDAPGHDTNNPLDIIRPRPDKQIVFNYSNIIDLTNGGVNIPQRGLI